MVEQTTNQFYKKAKIDQKHLDHDLVEKIQADCGVEINQLENRNTNKKIEPFCMFSLSTFQSKGQSEIVSSKKHSKRCHRHFRPS